MKVTVYISLLLFLTSPSLFAAGLIESDKPIGYYEEQYLDRVAQEKKVNQPRQPLANPEPLSFSAKPDLYMGLMVPVMYTVNINGGAGNWHGAYGGFMVPFSLVFSGPDHSALILEPHLGVEFTWMMLDSSYFPEDAHIMIMNIRYGFSFKVRSRNSFVFGFGVEGVTSSLAFSIFQEEATLMENSFGATRGSAYILFGYHIPAGKKIYVPIEARAEYGFDVNGKLVPAAGIQAGFLIKL